MDEIIFDPNADTSHFNRKGMTNKRAKIIALEGNDGSGKSTQIKHITTYLKSIGKTYKHVHFPAYGDNYFSSVIEMFLRGNLGPVGEVDPLFLANMYALDRYKMKPRLAKFMDQYDYVLLDRYVFSNMAFQAAKYNSDGERQGIIRWIEDFEFKFLALPYPDVTLFFDVPVDILKNRLTKREKRDYLEDDADVHESDLELQAKVRQIYLGLTEFNGYNVISCVGSDGRVLSEASIFERYKGLL